MFEGKVGEIYSEVRCLNESFDIMVLSNLEAKEEQWLRKSEEVMNVWHWQQLKKNHNNVKQYKCFRISLKMAEQMN